MLDPILSDEELEAKHQAELAADPHLDRGEKARLRVEHAKATEERKANREAVQADYEAGKGL